jgi:hypothetical protein
MAQTIELEIPEALSSGLRLPSGVQQLLDKQDSGTSLTAAESAEAEGLVDLSEMLSLINLRSKNAA